jgi:hypothetical protein
MIGGSPPWRRTNLFFLPRHASRSRQYCVAVPFSSVSVTFPTLPCASLRPQHRRSTPFKLHNAPVCRNRGRPPSSRSIESAPSALLRLHFSWIRASDTSLGLPITDRLDMDQFRFADCSGFANVCATARESQVSYQSIAQQMERATSSRTTAARCQSLHSRQGMQARIRTSLRR